MSVFLVFNTLNLMRSYPPVPPMQTEKRTQNTHAHTVSPAFFTHPKCPPFPHTVDPSFVLVPVLLLPQQVWWRAPSELHGHGNECSGCPPVREVLEWPYTIGGAPPPPPPGPPFPPLQTKVTISGKNDVSNRENLVGPFFCTQNFGSQTPPPPLPILPCPRSPGSMPPW